MGDAQEKPRPDPPRDVDPRDDVHVSGSPVRCPFCHEDVAIEGEWSACSRCLARHHQPCWAEGGRCGSCGHDGAVRHEREAPRSEEDSRLRSVGAFGVALLLGVVALMAVALVGYLRSVSAHNAAVEARHAAERARAEHLAGQLVRQRPAGRYEKAGALVVEDGRGGFVAVLMASNEVVFGLGTMLDSIDAQTFVVLRPDGHRYVVTRPVGCPVTAYGPSAILQDATPRGLSAREVETLLRQVAPADLDLEALHRRVKGR